MKFIMSLGLVELKGQLMLLIFYKPYLAKKDMTVISTTTIDEYYKHFEKDHAMNRRFSIVTLKENTKEETLEILKGIKGYYESYHQLK